MTGIAEISEQSRKLDVEGTITSVGDPRTVNLRAGGTANVADAVISDNTGEIKLSLWNDQIEQVRTGSKIRIENGYTTTFKGEKQLNIGKYGKLTIIEY